MTRNFALAAGLVALGASTALANDTTCRVEDRRAGIHPQHRYLHGEGSPLHLHEGNPRRLRLPQLLRQGDRHARRLPDARYRGRADVGCLLWRSKSGQLLDFTVTQDGEAIEPELQQRAWANALDVTEEIKARACRSCPTATTRSRRLKTCRRKRATNGWPTACCASTAGTRAMAKKLITCRSGR